MPGRAGVHHALAIALALQHRTEDAIGHYRRAIEQEPRNADAHHNLAVALASRGELEEAIQHYREALELDPERLHAKHNLGISLALQAGRSAGSSEPAAATGETQAESPDAAPAH